MKINFAFFFIIRKLTLQIFFQSFLPAADWGPYLKEHRGERYKNMAEPREAIALRKALGKEEEMKGGKVNAAYQHDSTAL